MSYSITRTASIGLDTRHLFVEGLSDHAFLFDVYGRLPHSQLLTLAADGWSNKCERELEYLEASLTASMETLTFLTLDPWVYRWSALNLIGLLDRLEIPAFGILHRLPCTPEQQNYLRDTAKRLNKILVLSEGMERRLRDEYGVQNVAYLPLHPPHHLYMGRDRQAIRESLEIRSDQVVFSFIGEARKGKGIELLLAALEHVPPADRARMFFLFAGRGKDFDSAHIQHQLAVCDAHGLVDLRQSKDPFNYSVLTEREFGRYVAASDFGLLLYQEDQRNCMSGCLPNFVWGRIPVLATKNSIVGEQVLKYELGTVLTREIPEEVAEALVSALHQKDAVQIRSDNFEAFRSTLAPALVVESLAQILEPSQPTPPLPGLHEKHKMEPTLIPDFETFLSKMPMLHTWDGGKTWNEGGFMRDHLERLHNFLKKNLPASPVLLETGAGNSTISFVFLAPQKLITIAPEKDLFNRIRFYCETEGIPTTALEVHVDCSEWVLPKMADEIRDKAPILDFALIDGCHNSLMVMIDFYYINNMLKKGGYIMIDDVGLHSVKELVRMLSEQPGFELALDLGKALVFQRTTAARTLPDWIDIPYIVRKSPEY